MGRSIFYPFHTTNVDMASALVYKLGCLALTLGNFVYLVYLVPVK